MKLTSLKNRIFLVMASFLASLMFGNVVLASSSVDFTQVDLARNGNSPTGQNFNYTIAAGSFVEDVLNIQNTSDKPIEFILFSADTKIDDGDNFILKGRDELNDGLGAWISFSEEKFVVQPQSDKKVLFSIKVPISADVGLHKGGILVQRHMESDDGLGLNLQQGVYVSVDVPGELVKSSEFNSKEFEDLRDFYKVFYSFQNTGTVSLDATARLTVSSLLLGGERVYEKNLNIPRGASEYAEFDWEHPAFGMYTVRAELIDRNTGDVYAVSPQNNFVFIPYLEFFIISFLILAIIFRRELMAFLYKCGAKNTVNHLLIIVSIALVVSYFHYRFPLNSPRDLSASITISDRELSEEEKAATYYLVARWGHATYGIEEGKDVYMDADIFLSGATFSIKKELSFDEDDSATLKGEDRVLEIDSQINDDYDGIVMTIQTDKNKAFNVAFEDKVRNHVQVYSIAELSKGVTVEAQRGSPYTFGKAELKLVKTDDELDSYLESSGVNSATGSSGVLLTFNSATPDVASAEDIKKEDALAVLQNILSEDSATPDLKNSVSLDSGLVEEIVRSEVGSEVLASKEFISELLATPAVLSALAATANANVVFLPSDTVIFPKQDFSFEERKIASTVIGTMVFVHKKEKPWNAYVSASDFQILAGNSAISASNLSVIPGPIIPINNSNINTSEIRRGQKHRLQNDEDQAVLVTSDAPKDAMFIMRPRLELILPPATRSGVYRGNLTITYIDKK